MKIKSYGMKLTNKMDDEIKEPVVEPLQPQTQSEKINELAGALAQAQGAMKPARKGAANTFFKSTYADLSEVIEASRSPLAVNNLSIVQYAEDGHVVTQLMHKSGQWIRGRLRITPKDNSAQAVGSALTYARRYSYQMLIGQASADDPTDDDGEAAMGREPSAKAPPKRKRKAKAKKVVEEPKVETTETTGDDKHESKTETTAEQKIEQVDDALAIVQASAYGEEYLRHHDIDPENVPTTVQERIMSKGVDGFCEMVATWKLEKEEGDKT